MRTVAVVACLAWSIPALAAPSIEARRAHRPRGGRPLTRKTARRRDPRSTVRQLDHPMRQRQARRRRQSGYQPVLGHDARLGSRWLWSRSRAVVTEILQNRAHAPHRDYPRITARQFELRRPSVRPRRFFSVLRSKYGRELLDQLVRDGFKAAKPASRQMAPARWSRVRRFAARVRPHGRA